MRKISLLVLLLMLLQQEAAPAGFDESARQELQRRDIPFSSEGLEHCIQEDDAAAVWLFLAAGMNPNSNLGNKVTPLLQAAGQGRKEVVRLLLSQGAKVNARDEWKQTPLVSAAQAGEFEIVKMLLDRGADINAVDENGWSALMHAAESGHIKTVKTLLAAGADVNIIGKGWGWGNPPRGLINDTMDRLLGRGFHAPPNEDQAWTALSCAAANGHPATVAAIMEKKPHVNVTGKDGGSALMRAAIYGHAEIVERLLAAHAKVTVNASATEKAIISTMLKNRPEVLHELLAKGADPNAIVFNERSLLRVASGLGYAGAVKMLLEQGADAEREWGGVTALEWAAYKGRAEVVEILLSRSSDSKARNKALSQAAGNGHAATVEILLKHGANVNAEEDSALEAILYSISDDIMRAQSAQTDQKNQDLEGFLSPMHSRDFMKTFHLLLENGADVNRNEAAAFFLAAQWTNSEVIRACLEKGALVNARDTDQRTPLLCAAEAGNSDNVRVLLDAGADVEAKDKEGTTALMSAAKNGRVEVVQVLLKAGANAHAKDAGGWTALEHARWGQRYNKGKREVSEKYTEIMDMLEKTLRVDNSP